MKLNVDGSTLKDTVTVGTRGTIRDVTRRWITGFTAQTGNYSIEVAETCALLYGLKVA